MKYDKIYEEEFLEKFKDKKEKIKNIELKDEEYSIDLEKISKNLGLKVEKTILFSESGLLDLDKKTIYINKFEKNERQRFTLAHEIGHYVLEHASKNKLPRKKKENYNDNEILKEREANQFAANLLMPRKILIMIMKKYLDENGVNKEGNLKLNNLEFKKLLEYISEKMKVSVSAIKYRLDNLNIIKKV